MIRKSFLSGVQLQSSYVVEVLINLRKHDMVIFFLLFQIFCNLYKTTILGNISQRLVLKDEKK